MAARDKRQRRCRGFTLIEALVTMAVLVIVLSIAAPSFRAYTQAQRVKNASFEFVAAMSYARSEAIARRANVVIAAQSDDFANGWTITAGGTTLRQQGALGGVEVTASATSITYGLDGRVEGAVTAMVKPLAGSGSTEKRCISVDPTGMPRSRKTTATTC